MWWVYVQVLLALQSLGNPADTLCHMVLTWLVTSAYDVPYLHWCDTYTEEQDSQYDDNPYMLPVGCFITDTWCKVEEGKYTGTNGKDVEWKADDHDGVLPLLS